MTCASRTSSTATRSWRSSTASDRPRRSTRSTTSSPGGRLTDEIPDRFDYIVASHVIEHTICLVCFLEDCAGLLRPGGALTLAIPDKRYSFDRFRERTAIGRVIDTHDAGPKTHTPGSVIEHHLGDVRKGEKGAWWAGAPGTYRSSDRLAYAMEQAEAAAKGTYIDTHNWVFTPAPLPAADARPRPARTGDAAREGFPRLGGPGVLRHALARRCRGRG